MIAATALAAQRPTPARAAITRLARRRGRPRQHAGRRPPGLHRPARVRALRGRRGARPLGGVPKRSLGGARASTSRCGCSSCFAEPDQPVPRHFSGGCGLDSEWLLQIARRERPRFTPRGTEPRRARPPRCEAAPPEPERPGPEAGQVPQAARGRVAFVLRRPRDSGLARGNAIACRTELGRRTCDPPIRLLAARAPSTGSARATRSGSASCGSTKWTRTSLGPWCIRRPGRRHGRPLVVLDARTSWHSKKHVW